MPELEIDELYRIAKGGDPRGKKLLFEQLNARFRLLVRRRLWGESDWEDVVQEALAVVAQKYDQVDPATGFAAWAYQILKYKLMNYAQAKQRDGARTGALDEAGYISTASHSDPEMKRRLKECAQKIWQVNTRYARILDLHYQGYTTEEICRTQDLTRNNFYSILSRARGMLARCLETGEIG